MKKLLALIVALPLLCITAHAQNVFQTTNGGIDDDGAVAIVPSGDGGVVVAGFSSSYGLGLVAAMLQKFDSFGNLVWTQTYGGSANDVFSTLKATADGGFIAGGSTNSFSDFADDDMYLVKVSSSGTVEWSATYGGSSGDNLSDLALTDDGGYILTGRTNSYSAGASNDTYVVKVSGTGALEWSRTYGIPDENDFSANVQQTSDGGYIIAANGRGAGGLLDAFLIKTDASGDTLWTANYGGVGNDYATAVHETSDGGYALAGYTASFGAGSHDFMLIKTDANGNLQSLKTHGTAEDEQANAMLALGNDHVLLSGASGLDQGVLAMRLNAAGDMVWARTYGEEAGDGLGSTMTPDGGFAFASTTWSGASLNSTAIKVTGTGQAACFEGIATPALSTASATTGRGLVVLTGAQTETQTAIGTAATPGVTQTCNAVGIAELAPTPVQLYPNPATEVCTLEMGPDVRQVVVRSVYGQVVASYPAQGNTLQLDVSSLARGLYLVETQSPKTTSVSKLLVQ